MAVLPALLLNMLLAICPKLPYENSFGFEIRPGFQMTLMGQTNEGYREGLISPTKQGFIINLNGENIYDGLKVLHVNPRFDENSTMVLNSKYNYTWGPEERHFNHQMAGDEDFVLVIQAHENQFKIFVNGRHFADYKYRQPLNLITGITIKGLINVHQFIAKQYDLSALPVPETHIPSNVIVQKGFPLVLKNPTTPIEVPFPGEMRKGMVVALEGAILGDSYLLWLTNSGQATFHLHPFPKENKMSTHFTSGWGPDFSVDSPFELNKQVLLLVKTNLTDYEVWVNGEHFYDYKNRQLPTENATKIKFDNNIRIDSLTITY